MGYLGLLLLFCLAGFLIITAFNLYYTNKKSIQLDVDKQPFIGSKRNDSYRGFLLTISYKIDLLQETPIDYWGKSIFLTFISSELPLKKKLKLEVCELGVIERMLDLLGLRKPKNSFKYLDQDFTVVTTDEYFLESLMSSSKDLLKQFMRLKWDWYMRLYNQYWIQPCIIIKDNKIFISNTRTDSESVEVLMKVAHKLIDVLIKTDFLADLEKR